MACGGKLIPMPSYIWYVDAFRAWNATTLNYSKVPGSCVSNSCSTNMAKWLKNDLKIA